MYTCENNEWSNSLQFQYYTQTQSLNRDKKHQSVNAMGG